VVETMDGSQAEIDETRRAEADERRTQAQKEREPLKQAERVKDAFSDTLRGEAETFKRAAAGTTEAIQQGSKLFGLATDEAGEVARQTSGDLRALAQSGEAFGRGVQSISREWLELSQTRMQRNLDDLSAVFRSRTFSDLVAAQTNMVRHNFEMMVENGQRLMRSSMRMTEKVRQPLEQRSEDVR
jgi:hypothetical protein